MAEPNKTPTATGLNALLPWLRRAVDLVYPRNCLLCGEPLGEAEPGVVCPVCLAKAKPIEPPRCERCALPFPGSIDTHFVCGYCKDLKFQFSRAVAGYQAEGVVRDCIHRFKYNRELWFEVHLANWIVATAQRWIDWNTVDALVPVPLFPRKQRHREFNQAERLARAVGQAVAKPVLIGNLRRIKETKTQTRLDAKQRAENLRNAFAVRRPEKFTGQRLVLVDDVFTTGATLDSCAKALRRAGAADVTVLVLARGV